MKISKILKIVLPLVLGVAAVGGISYGVYYAVSQKNYHEHSPIISNISLEEANKTFGEGNVKVNKDNVEINGYNAPLNVEELILPSRVDNKNVVYTQEFKEQFRQQMGMDNPNSPNEKREQVKMIHIPKIVDGDYSFLTIGRTDKPNPNNKIIFENLETVVLDDSITQLPDAFFVGCSKLTSINIPNSMTNISNEFLKGTAITEIFIPKNIKTIGYSAFQNIQTLKSVTFDNTIKDIKIDSKAFDSCNNLQIVDFKNINSIFDKLSQEVSPNYSKFWWIFNNITPPSGLKINVYLNETLKKQLDELISANQYKHDFIQFLVR